MNGTPRGTPRAAAARNTPRSTPGGGGGAKRVRSSPRVEDKAPEGDSVVDKGGVKKYVEAGCQTSPGFVAKVKNPIVLVFTFFLNQSIKDRSKFETLVNIKRHNANLSELLNV